MAEALADALILSYKREEALSRAFSDWWNHVEKVLEEREGHKVLVPRRPSDAAKLDQWRSRLEAIRQKREEAIGGVIG